MGGSFAAFVACIFFSSKRVEIKNDVFRKKREYT